LEGVVRLHAAGVESRRDDDPPTDWLVPIDEVDEALDRAYRLVVEWMEPSTHFHPPAKAPIKSAQEP
jgi:hypothetical protein